MRTIIWLLAIASLGSLAAAARAETITAEGMQLADRLDEMGVERLWLAGKSVAWKTGKPLEKQPNDGKPHTHCSAFVAAAAMKLDIYILRPPEHSSSFLANAQFDWLHGDDAKVRGWRPADTGLDAQRLANQGKLVVAVLKEADPKRHGHIAIVRPSTRAEGLIMADGPQIIQAGMDNFRSATLKQGFRHHRDAERQVRYFVHDVERKE